MLPDDTHTNDQTIRVIRLVLELTGTALMIWYMLPAHQRKSGLMWTAQQCRKVTHWMARKSGRYAMNCELSGDRETAHVGYGIAYDLMRGPFERIGQWYNTLRES